MSFIKRKISFIASVLTISCIGIICSSLIVFFPTLDDPPPFSTTDIIVPKEILAELPVRLSIPKIHVDTFIEYVGLTAAGAMDTPAGPNDVAWFDLGPRPGNIGSAVIAGHYGWKDNIPAVFDNISGLHKGDKIITIDAMGSTTTFVVSKIEIFGENDSSATVFGSTDGGAHLNLITCEGIWNAVTKSYSGRLVVFADKEIKK